MTTRTTATTTTTTGNVWNTRATLHTGAICVVWCWFLYDFYQTKPIKHSIQSIYMWKSKRELLINPEATRQPLPLRSQRRQSRTAPKQYINNLIRNSRADSGRRQSSWERTAAEAQPTLFMYANRCRRCRQRKRQRQRRRLRWHRRQRRP